MGFEGVSRVLASVFMGRAIKKYSDLVRFAQIYSDGIGIGYLFGLWILILNFL